MTRVCPLMWSAGRPPDQAASQAGQVGQVGQRAIVSISVTEHCDVALQVLQAMPTSRYTRRIEVQRVEGMVGRQAAKQIACRHELIQAL